MLCVMQKGHIEKHGEGALHLTTPVSSLWNEREGITPLATRLGGAWSEPLLRAKIGVRQNRVHWAMNGGKRSIHRLGPTRNVSTHRAWLEFSKPD